MYSVRTTIFLLSRNKKLTALPNRATQSYECMTCLLRISWASCAGGCLLVAGTCWPWSLKCCQQPFQFHHALRSRGFRQIEQRGLLDGGSSSGRKRLASAGVSPPVPYNLFFAASAAAISRAEGCSSPFGSVSCLCCLASFSLDAPEAGRECFPCCAIERVISLGPCGLNSLILSDRKFETELACQV